MSSGKVSCKAGELAMFVAPGNSRCTEQRLCSGPQPAIAASHAPVFRSIRSGRNSFPARAIAHWANAWGSFNHRNLFQIPEDSFLSVYVAPKLTLHPNANFVQVPRPDCLCTTCEGAIESVEDRGKPVPH